MKEFNKLPIAVKIAVVIIVILVLNYLYKKLIKQTPPPAPVPAKKDLDKLADKNIKPTYSETQFSAWSEKLAQALNYFNTDETAVYSIFKKLNNEADLVKLIQVFGVRSIETAPFIGEDATLPQAIQQEMDADEIEKVNKILQSKGINYNF